MTPENNANVLIVRAIGPSPDGTALPEEYYRQLGIDPLPEEGAYLVPWKIYVEKIPLKPVIDNMGGMAFNPENHIDWNEAHNHAEKWPWKKSELPELAKWLQLNEKPLTLVAEGVKRSKYFNPLFPNPKKPKPPYLVNVQIPTVGYCRTLGTMLVIRAMGRMAENDWEGAWQDLQTCRRLGRQLTRGGFPIDVLIGIALDQLGMRSQVIFLSQVKADSETLRSWSEDVRQLPPFSKMADKLDLGERFTGIEAMVRMAIDGPAIAIELSGGAMQQDDNNEIADFFARGVDFDLPLRKMNESYDRASATLRIAQRREKRAAFDEFVRHVKQQLPTSNIFASSASRKMNPAERGEALGNLLTSLLFPAFRALGDVEDKHRQMEENLQLAFALAQYRLDHNGRYPQRLAELAPRYLKSIPNDLFTDKPLIYRLTKDGYLLYSLGPNMTDEEGIDASEMPLSDDIAVRMPATKPQSKPQPDGPRGPGFE